GAGRLEGNPEAPADRGRRTSHPIEETRIPRGQTKGHKERPPFRRERGPRAPRFRGEGRPPLRCDDRPGDRDESGPRDRTRRDARARLPPVVFREHGEGSKNEGGRAIPKHAKVQEAIQLAEATEVEHPKLAK